MKKTIVVLAIVVIGVVAGCSKSSGGGGGGAPVTCTGTQSFSADVNPIIQANCTSSGCHDATSSNGPGALMTYQRIFDARALIRSAVNSGTMPKNGSLSAAQRAAIICWIDSGAPNN